MKRDLVVQWRVFLGIAAFMLVIGVVYWFASYEEAGTTMLVLAGGLAGLVGGWLLVQDRKVSGAPGAGAASEADEAGEEHYLPAASVWPFGVGVGAALGLNGLILGWPFAVPGGLFLLLAVVGFVAEARRRA